MLTAERGCNYDVIMRAKIVRIGNSQGIRLPKSLLEQSGLGDEVELEVDGDQIIIRPARQPREGWGSAFERMAEAGDDTLLDGERVVATAFDEDEWTW